MAKHPPPARPGGASADRDGLDGLPGPAGPQGEPVAGAQQSKSPSPETGSPERGSRPQNRLRDAPSSVAWPEAAAPLNGRSPSVGHVPPWPRGGGGGRGGKKAEERLFFLCHNALGHVGPQERAVTPAHSGALARPLQARVVRPGRRRLFLARPALLSLPPAPSAALRRPAGRPRSEGGALAKPHSRCCCRRCRCRCEEAVEAAIRRGGGGRVRVRRTPTEEEEEARRVVVAAEKRARPRAEEEEEEEGAAAASAAMLEA